MRTQRYVHSPALQHLVLSQVLTFALQVSNDDGHNEPQYATSTLYQFYLLTKRAFTREWRDMVTNRSRIISALFLSIVLGLLFLQLDNHQVRFY